MPGAGWEGEGRGKRWPGTGEVGEGRRADLVTRMGQRGRMRAGDRGGTERGEGGRQ